MKRIKAEMEAHHFAKRIEQAKTGRTYAENRERLQILRMSWIARVKAKTGTSKDLEPEMIRLLDSLGMDTDNYFNEMYLKTRG